MPYCELSDFGGDYPLFSYARIAAMVGVEQGVNTLGPIISAAITAASGEIDREIGGRYQVPVPSTATQSLLILKNFCMILTVAWLFELNGLGELPKGLANAVENARTALTAYAIGYNIKGRVSVAIGLPDAPLQTGPVIVSPLAIAPSPENIAMNFFGTTTTEQAGP